ncbi:hypothetical protein APE_0334 [Aeropyrum pernix K1]|uniref:Uncharacterized protein n=1 Tax=Aeropyrum pernix (strain ATCC 700893 / DSM 11879 / JCM 9820 / NBRC 100138 / K1) TaxID=272557 RepID=Q9YFA7_AERPE|nr:hypothetical protein [Aeropyrum pernix]BAA79289.1 hypothetical protein APE_0334 [Aeropyrum pernix K1]
MVSRGVLEALVIGAVAFAVLSLLLPPPLSIVLPPLASAIVSLFSTRLRPLVSACSSLIGYVLVAAASAPLLDAMRLQVGIAGLAGLLPFLYYPLLASTASLAVSEVSRYFSRRA